jgi:hypothetical protein
MKTLSNKLKKVLFMHYINTKSAPNTGQCGKYFWTVKKENDKYIVNVKTRGSHNNNKIFPFLNTNYRFQKLNSKEYGTYFEISATDIRELLKVEIDYEIVLRDLIYILQGKDQSEIGYEYDVQFWSIISKNGKVSIHIGDYDAILKKYDTLLKVSLQYNIYWSIITKKGKLTVQMGSNNLFLENTEFNFIITLTWQKKNDGEVQTKLTLP